MIERVPRRHDLSQEDTAPRPHHSARSHVDRARGRMPLLAVALASPLVGAQPDAARSDALGAQPLRRASCAAGRPRAAAEGAVRILLALVSASLFGASPLAMGTRPSAASPCT
jgi:hypothetical protein